MLPPALSAAGLLEKDDWLAGLGAPTPAASSTGPNSMGTGLGASGNPRSYSSALIGGVSGGGHGNGASGFGSAQSRIDEMVRSWQTGEPCASSSWQHHPAHPAAAAQGPHAAQGQEGAEESAPVPRAAGSEGMGLQAGPSISAGTGAISGSGLYGRDNGFEVMQYLVSLLMAWSRRNLHPAHQQSELQAKMVFVRVKPI